MSGTKMKGTNQYIETVKDKRRDEREGQDKARRTFFYPNNVKEKKLGGGYLQQLEDRILIENADLDALAKAHC